jgi:hypothetical protein
MGFRRQVCGSGLASAAVALVALLFTSGAEAAVTVGQASTPTVACRNSAFIQPSYVVPSAGVLTSWKFHADSAPPQIKLKVARPEPNPFFPGGSVGQYRILADSELETLVPDAPNVFPVQIPVQAGDMIGAFVANPPGNCAVPGSGLDEHHDNAKPAGSAQDVPPGSFPDLITHYNDRQLAISARLEPDCDSDGLGDETQDPDIVVCEVPDTAIDHGPRDPTTHRAASFDFSATVPGSSFECQVDSGQYAPCSSPFQITVRRGEHVFSVRATSPLDVPDASAASDEWTVKKKRKHKK